MKAPFFTAASFQLGLLASLTAQNFTEPAADFFEEARRVTEVSPMMCELPVVKAQASAPESLAVYMAQDTTTLEPRLVNRQAVDSVVDLSVLQKASAFRNLAAGRSDAGMEVGTHGIQQDLALISATYRESGERENDCQKLALSVEQRAKLDSSEVLTILEKEMKSNPSCTCEIVKAAIRATDADADLVVAILETAITISPESMRVASQCAIAIAPESLAGVQALLSQYDVNAGDAGESAKSAKGPKGGKVAAIQSADTVAAMPNPLDFPGKGPIGPPGGGQPYFKPVPPVIVPRLVTEVSP
ncbi:MAG: hypothetical protein ACRCXD_06910 [Luteolibacter sp.]